VTDGGVGLRGAVGRALAIDRSGFAPVLALRSAAGVAIPVAVGVAVGHPAEGSIAAAGALPAGVAAFGGGFRTQAGLITATAVGMAVSTFVGSLVAGHVGVTLAALAVWAFAAGLMTVLGRPATIVGTQAVMGLVVFGRFPGSVETAAAHAGWVLVGAGFQGLLAAAFRSPQRFLAERRTLASAFAELATLARDATRSSLTAASTTAMAASLIDRREPDDDVGLLRGLADEADRIRLEIQSLATVATVATATSALRAASDWLDGVADAIRLGACAPDEPPALGEDVEALRSERETAPPGRAGTSTRYAAARTSALLGQLRAVDRLVNALAGVRRITLPRRLGAPVVLALPRRVADALRQVQVAARDPSSVSFRHAVRFAVVLTLCEGISHALPWQRGYWITLTAAVVLKPDYAATAQRGLARVLGTAIGVVAAGLLVAAVDPTGGVVVALLAISAWAGYACFAASYALYSVAVTMTVVLLLAPLGGNELHTVADRGLDTLIGGAIAMLAYAVWPTWETGTLAATTSRLLAALAGYAEALLSAYVDPEAADSGRIANAATAARRARMAMQASYDRAVAEPARGGADTATAAGVLSASRRIAIELHALRATVEDAAELVPVPEVAEIRDALVDALRGLAAGDPGAVRGLRDRQQALEDDPDEDLSTLHARRRALVAAHLDPLVDSIDTVAHVVRA
jgi:uncharacterized membrane protein YccC